MKNLKKNKFILVLPFIIIIGLVLFAFKDSFAFFKYIKKGEIVNVITISGLDVKVDDSSNGLVLENAYPVGDVEGSSNEPFIFNIKNSTSSNINYSISVDNDSDKQEECKLADGSTCPILSTNYIKYSYRIGNEGSYSTPSNLGSDSNIVLTSVINSGEEFDIYLKIWVDGISGNEIMNHAFYGKLIISGGKAE